MSATNSEGYEPIVEVVDHLLFRRAFRDIASAPALLRLRDEHLSFRIQSLCQLGARLLDLDAEDFGDAPFVPGVLAARIKACWMPQHAAAQERGALRDLRPIYSHLLEALTVYWERDEMLQVSAILHLVAEYLPLLAWQSVLGHAGDPRVLASWSARPGALWGTGQQACRQSPRQQQAARRSLTAVGLAAEDWRRYLDREHSHVAAGFAKCSDCSAHCAVRSQIDGATLADLRRRVALTRRFSASPVVRLRHAAPVGHGFGVPNRSELAAAWTSTYTKIVDAPPPPDDYPMPGLPQLLSTIADSNIEVGSLISEVSDHLAAALRVAYNEPSGCGARPVDRDVNVRE